MRQLNKIWPLIVSGFVISGCVSTPGIKQFNSTEYTIAGKRIEIASVWHIQPDCENFGIPIIQVISKPKNGKVELSTKQMFPSDTIYERCRTIKVKGPVAYYTANSGFSGTDTIKLRFAYSDGVLEEKTLTVIVK
ncbi:hypothetical protein [Pseudochrobactrum kiredjianiae]|uniref:Lipoprotein n=1 Tax=Pseudochrobactrum kiredjianiae TaxID=386305 RepID=A0ABW3V943_9HYPH|nr:hypothetical protein [Pseudochrobactrum kiredjianiae]MDM7851320.1 hypothetical protein [Pseudochrobactrum kiredjianiae]